MEMAAPVVRREISTAKHHTGYVNNWNPSPGDEQGVFNPKEPAFPSGNNCRLVAFVPASWQTPGSNFRAKQAIESNLLWQTQINLLVLQ